MAPVIRIHCVTTLADPPMQCVPPPPPVKTPQSSPQAVDGRSGILARNALCPLWRCLSGWLPESHDGSNPVVGGQSLAANIWWPLPSGQSWAASRWWPVLAGQEKAANNTWPMPGGRQATNQVCGDDPCWNTARKWTLEADLVPKWGLISRTWAKTASSGMSRRDDLSSGIPSLLDPEIRMPWASANCPEPGSTEFPRSVG